MGKGLTGIHFLLKGKRWREKYLGGLSIDKIALEEGQNRQVVSRCIWLAKIPEDLKKTICEHPDIFSRKTLVDTFAAKRRQCEQDGFKILYKEVKQMIIAGAGSKPVLKKTNKNSKLTTKSTKKIQKEINNSNESQINPIFFHDKSIEAEFRIKEALSLHACVSFSQKGSGEVRIFFENDKDLEFILERVEDVRFKHSDKIENKDKPYWDLLT